MRLTALPLLVWLRSYDRACLRGDLVAGITIGVMLIPQGMAYAMVAGLPPEYGLYASIFPPLMYALLGSSNKVSLGPVALDAILIISGLRLIAPPGSDHYLELALTLTLLVGAMQLLLGLVRFGFIVNFLSYPVITGYTSAAAVIMPAPMAARTERWFFIGVLKPCRHSCYFSSMRTSPMVPVKAKGGL